MSLVFAGACSHGPGITARSERADPARKARLDQAFERMRRALMASRPEALIVLAAEHFANFFMNNMPSFAIGVAEHYEGPIEDPAWLRIERRRIPGARELSLRLVEGVMQTVDISYCEEWKFDHGIMVPLHHLTPGYDLPIIPVNINCQSPPMAPLHRVHALGQAIRRTCDALDARIALVATGGLSHWPCTPDSGKINQEWDRTFLDAWLREDVDEVLSYTDADVYREGGQGAYELRTHVALLGATAGCPKSLWCYEPIPEFACGCSVAVAQMPAA